MTRRHAPSRRALTLVELLLASAVTAMVAMAVASMMTSVSSVAQHDRDNRSALLRAHALREALRAYLEPSLAVVQMSNDDASVVLWIEDDVAPGLANILELRLIRFDAPAQQIVAERVVLPDVWHPVLKQNTNVVMSSNLDCFAMFEGLRSMGMTREVVLASGIASLTWTTNENEPRNSSRLRAQFELLSSDPMIVNPTPMLAAFGLADHRSPSR